MKLWILRATQDDDYENVRGFVVRAKDAGRARKLASEQPGLEGEGVWLSADRSTCFELTAPGKEEVILRDLYG